MSLQFERQGHACVARVEGEMTIYTAAELRQSLLEKLGDCQELEIDLSQLTEFDTAGLQLLISLKQLTLDSDLTLQLKDHSEAAVEVLDLLDLQGYFGDPVVIPAGWKKDGV